MQVQVVLTFAACVMYVMVLASSLFIKRYLLMVKTTEEDFLVQLGMFTDKYTCKHCGLEWNLLISPHHIHHTECKDKIDESCQH